LSRELVRASCCPDEAFEPLGVVLLSGEEPVGYALARIRKEEIALHEFGLRSRDEDLWNRLLAYLRREAQARGCSRFVSGWPPGRWGELFEGRFAPIERDGGVLMVASLSPMLDVDAIAEGSRGSWQTDHI
jgi:hypothetical protein